MFDTVFNEITWDSHADGGSLAVRLDDYKETLCPMFDLAYTALLDDLKQRGMLDTTLVLAMGEFGRTPQLNPRGGRDHWPGVWSVLFAGAGVRGGQVVGASDRIGGEPKDRPVDAGRGGGQRLLRPWRGPQHSAARPGELADADRRSGADHGAVPRMTCIRHFSLPTSAGAATLSGWGKRRWKRDLA